MIINRRGLSVYGWGDVTDKQVSGDYDGDSRGDIAVWRSSQGTWYIIQRASSTGAQQYLGSAVDILISSA